MKRTFTHVAVAAALLCGLPLGAYANGINSPPGVDVAIGAGGNQIMRLTTAGLVGIGTAEPHANLSVNGGVQVGTDTVCDDTKAGTLSYDSSAKQFKFCDGTRLQTVGSGEGGGYVTDHNGNCLHPNTLTVSPPTCTCPSGYTAAPTSNSYVTADYPGTSTVGTWEESVGYTCFTNSPTPTAAPGHWVRQGTDPRDSGNTCEVTVSPPDGQPCGPVGTTMEAWLGNYGGLAPGCPAGQEVASLYMFTCEAN